jgi:hypothetical protein
MTCVCCGKKIRKGELMNFIPILDAPCHVPVCPVKSLKTKQ